MSLVRFFIGFAAFAFMPSFASAKVPTPALCLDAARTVEKEYDIPPYILAAISLTETGQTRKIDGQRLHTPWPWTLNVRGKGYFFKNRTQLLSKVNGLIRAGESSFDVGCMQINWRYHGEAFASAADAIDPIQNMRYAAEFLTSLYNRTGSWPTAVERYHSSTPKHYERYRRKVTEHWETAFNLMSPYNGTLRTLFPNDIIAPPEKPRAEDPASLYRLRRMRKVAQLQAQVQSYVRTADADRN